MKSGVFSYLTRVKFSCMRKGGEHDSRVAKQKTPYVSEEVTDCCIGPCNHQIHRVKDHYGVLFLSFKEATLISDLDLLCLCTHSIQLHQYVNMAAL